LANKYQLHRQNAAAADKLGMTLPGSKLWARNKSVPCEKKYKRKNAALYLAVAESLTNIQ